MDLSNIINNLSTEIQTEKPKEETSLQNSSENISIFNNNSNDELGSDINSTSEEFLSFEFEELSNYIYNKNETPNSTEEIPEESVEEVEKTNDIESYIENTFTQKLEENNINYNINEKEIINIIENRGKSSSKASINDIVNRFIEKLINQDNQKKDSSGRVNIASSQTIYNDKTKEEIEADISSFEIELETAKKSFSSILDNSAEELQTIKSEVNEKYENYYNELNKIDPAMAQELNKHVKTVAELEEKRDKKIQETYDKAEELNEAKNYANCCTLKASEVYTTKINIENSLNEVNKLLENTTDETQRKNLEAQKKYLEMENEKLSAEYETLEAEEKKAREDYLLKQEELDNLNNELRLAEEELTFANTNKENYEQNIRRKHPEITSVQTTYNDAKAIYEQTRCDKLYEYANNIESAQANKNAAELKISTINEEENSKRIKRNIDAMKKYDSSAGNNILSASQSIVGENETSSGYCLRDVHYALSKAYRGKTTSLPTGYSSAYQTAEALRGNIAGYEDIASNFVEIEITDPKDLKNLPAGAVVVWDNNDSNHPYGHVSIADGKGNEYSDFKGTQMTGYGTKCYVFIPVS